MRVVFGAVITLLSLLLCLLVVDATQTVPVQVPITLKNIGHAPRQLQPPPSTSLPLLEVAPPPEARSAGLYHPDEFPSEPSPRPNYNDEPLPLSPPPTY